MDISAISRLSRGELQGAYCLLLLSKAPDPHAKIRCEQIASTRRIWLPETREQAAGLLFRGETPTHGFAETF